MWSPNTTADVCLPREFTLVHPRFGDIRTPAIRSLPPENQKKAPATGHRGSI